MKLYTYTKKRSLPRLALRGLPAGSELYGDEHLFMLADGAYGDDTPEDPIVVLEVDASQMTLNDLDLDGDWRHLLYEWGATDEQIDAVKTVEDAVKDTGWVQTLEPVPPTKIKVLGGFRPNWGEHPADVVDSAEDLTRALVGPAKPLTAFRQAFVTRLMRSIFLPRHKLYGAGTPRMGTSLVEVMP